MILVKQTFSRAVNSYSHREPLYYLVLRLPSHYFPWGILLPFAAWSAFGARKSGQAGGAAFAAVWAVAYVAFFSLISGKRTGYILPIAPALGILSAWYLAGPASAGGRASVIRLWLHRLAFSFLAFLALVFIGAAALTGVILPRIEEDPVTLQEALAVLTPAWRLCMIAAFLLPAAVVCIGLVQAVRGRISDHLLAAAVILFIAVLLPCVGTAGNVFKSGRLFCEQARPYIEQASAVHLYPQDFSGVYNLYTERVSIPVIPDKETLQVVLAEPGTLVIGRRKNLLTVFTPDQLADMTLVARSVGHRRMLLVRGGAGRPAGG
jgi:hypothetical protein